MSKPVVKKIDIRKMPREGWQDLRRKYIGGSDIAAVLGHNRWRSAIDVWLDKTGRAEDRPASEAMRQGTDFEPYVADRFCEATGKKVRRVNFMLMTDAYPNCAANIDREVIGEDALLECKTTSVYSADQWEEGKEVPLAYYCQVQWYLGITGKQKAYLACLILNSRFLYREIERDEEVISALFSAAEAFWEDYVKKDKMPPPDGSVAAGEALGEVYAHSNPDGIVELYAFGGRLKRYRELMALKDEIENESEKIKQEIQAEMGEAEFGFLGDTKVAWKSVAGRRTVDAKKLAAEQPEIFEKYSKVGKPSRRFTIKYADD